jgi:hypothetical protein
MRADRQLFLVDNFQLKINHC